MAVIFGTSGNDYRLGTSSNDQMYGLEGFDTIDGSGGNDLIYGNQQGDILFGGSGLDVMYGGQGGDSLDGSTANDRLYGDNGNDTVRGGSGTDTLSGGSGADLFFYSADIITDFSSSEGDRLGFGSFRTSSFSSAVFSVSSSENIPYFIELKQQGEDLLIGDSWSEGYTTLIGLGETINDPLPLLSSIDFSNGFLFGNSEENSEPETDSKFPDPLTGLIESEANLTQAIEYLKAGGSLYDLGFQGPGLETLKPEDLQGALSEVQGRIADELTQPEVAEVTDSLLLPEAVQPGKQVFLIEEGTAIPLDIQEEMIGDEILFLPSGYFNLPASESLF